MRIMGAIMSTRMNPARWRRGEEDLGRGSGRKDKRQKRTSWGIEGPWPWGIGGPWPSTFDKVSLGPVKVHDARKSIIPNDHQTPQKGIFYIAYYRLLYKTCAVFNQKGLERGVQKCKKKFNKRLSIGENLFGRVMRSFGIMFFFSSLVHSAGSQKTPLILYFRY
jgi:hypothetical protein